MSFINIFSENEFDSKLCWSNLRNMETTREEILSSIKGKTTSAKKIPFWWGNTHLCFNSEKWQLVKKQQFGVVSGCLTFRENKSEILCANFAPLMLTRITWLAPSVCNLHPYPGFFIIYDVRETHGLDPCTHGSDRYVRLLCQTSVASLSEHICAVGPF